MPGSALDSVAMLSDRCAMLFALPSGADVKEKRGGMADVASPGRDAGGR